MFKESDITEMRQNFDKAKSIYCYLPALCELSDVPEACIYLE